MKKSILFLFFILPFMGLCQSTLVKWTFPAHSADSISDGGSFANQQMKISLHGGTNPMSFAVGAGGSPDSCAVTTKWTAGTGAKYWQIQFVSLGFNNLKVSSRQNSTGTGPRDFKVQYRLGLLDAWTDVAGATVVDSTDWTRGVLNNVSLPVACDNQDTVFLRWIMTSDISVTGGTVGSTGKSRIDDIIIIGDTIAPPIFNAVSANATSDSTVTVVFNNPVDCVSAQNMSNYSGLGTINSIICNGSDTITLILANHLSCTDTLSLIVSNVQDTSGTVMSAPKTFTITYCLFLPPNVVITEIMYNPPTGNSAFEFIELYNNGSTPANLRKFNLTVNTVNYNFPDSNIIVNLQEYVVVARNIAEFNKFVPTHTFKLYAWNSGTLPNADTIILKDNTGNVIDSVIYASNCGASGNGSSLIMCNPICDNSNCNLNWIESNPAISNTYISSSTGATVYVSPGSGIILSCNVCTNGIDDMNTENGISIYPNPANDKLIFEVNPVSDCKDYSYSIFNIQGQLLRQQALLKERTEIDISAFPKGVYIIKISDSENNNFTRKFVIQ